MEERKAEGKSTSFEDMIAYVDENGNIVDTPPDPTKKTEVDAEDIDISVTRDTGEVDPIKKGTVDYYDDSKGFGFILEKGSQHKYFFHINGCVDEVKQGNMVSFELEKGPKGLNAVNVRKA